MKTQILARLVCLFLTDLTEPTNRPLVGQFVFPGEVQAPLLARDEGLGSGVGGPGLHPGHRLRASACPPPRPAAGTCTAPQHSTETRLAVTSSPENHK